MVSPVFAVLFAISLLTPQPAEPGVAPGAAVPPVVGAVAEMRLGAVWAGGETRRYRYSQRVSEKTGSAETPETFVERQGTMRMEVGVTRMVATNAPPDSTALGFGETAYQMTIDSLRLTAAMPQGGEVVFDSADPELCKDDNRFSPSARPLVGATVVFVADAAGKVVRAEGYDELLDISSPSARLAVQIIESTSIGAKFGPVLGFVAPGAGAVVDAKWEQSRSVPYVPGIVLEVVDVCTVTGLDGALVTVASTGTPTLRIPNPGRLGTREVAASNIHATTTWDAGTGGLRRHEATMATDVLLKAANKGPGSVGLVRNRVESVLEAIE